MKEFKLQARLPETEVSVCVDEPVITIQIVLPQIASVTDPEQFAEDVSLLLSLLLAPEFARPYYGGDESVGDYV